MLRWLKLSGSGTNHYWPAHARIARELGLRVDAALYWAHVERVGFCDGKCSGLIRIFEDGQEWGDPYRYVFPFRMIDEKTIELYGVVGRGPTIGEVRAMVEACRARGWKLIFRRKLGANPGLHEHE